MYIILIPWNYPYSIEFGNVSGGDLIPGYSMAPSKKTNGKISKVFDGKFKQIMVYKPTSYTQSPVVKNLYFQKFSRRIL